MPAPVTTTIRGDIAIITIDNPPVNALGQGVPEALLAAVVAADDDPAIAAMIVMGAGRTFVAGADINALEDVAWGDLAAAPDLHGLLARIEDSHTPVIMAIHGTALGGGLELAMAGHFRLATPDAKLGLPEVNLGIIPGAEGTQRLPRLVGVAKAVEICVSGRPITASDALAADLIDSIADGDLVEAAVMFAADVIARGVCRRPTRDCRERLGTPEANADAFARGKELAAKVRRNETAPLHAIDAIAAAASLDWAAGCARERAIFFDCVQSEQAKAMIHGFFAERAAAKIGAGGDDAAPRPIRTVAIVGAGTMGAGIATACANAGLPVILTDASSDALAAGLAAIQTNYAASVSRGRLAADAADERLARIRTSPDIADFGAADLVIEAVYEDLELKRAIFRDLDRVMKPGALLATNTSTLDIDRIADATARPEDVVGLHFFSPAPIMRLVEVVRGRRTSVPSMTTAMAVAKRLGKVGVLVGNEAGFVGNRMMFRYMYETQFLVEEGSTPEDVDHALTDFGMAMGIFAVDDMAGIDVMWRVRQSGLFPGSGDRRPLVHDRLYELGRLGQKTGKGWYRYDAGRIPSPDPEVIDLVRRLAREAGVAQRTFTPNEIVDRAISALVNEGARALEAGVARSAADIDVIYTTGYGFPRWRGGPMFYADRVGLAKVLDRIAGFHRDLGTRWEPAPLLVTLARDGRTFRDLDRSRRESDAIRA